MKPISNEGGATYSYAAEPTATKCRTYGKNTGITLDTNNAATFKLGLDISGLVGFDVSAKSGYSSSEKVSVAVSAAAGRQICGTNVYPAEHPSRVVVKAP